jgi:acetyltransferase-like isoleucine patch superfamily enzyme/acyl carrier protein
MMASQAADVRQAILGLVAPKLEAIGLSPDDLGEDFDLLGEGALDSFGFLELVTMLEQRFSVTLDFEDVDPEQLALFGPFCSYVEARVAGNGVSPAYDGSAASDSDAVPADGAGIESPTLPEPHHASLQRRALGRAAADLYSGGIRFRDKLFSLCIGGSFASFGPHTVIQLPTRLVGERRIAIGSDGFVGANSWLQALDTGDEAIAISIGDGVSIAGMCVLSSAGSIRIGRNVSFARNVYIADHSHVYDDPTQPVLEQGVTASRPVEIGDGAWLGENVFVLPGVRIGRGAVISANSVVNGDIPDHAVAAGSPARIVRFFGHRAAPTDA